MINSSITRPLKAFIRHFDRLLSRLNKIKEFSTAPQVIVRIQVIRLSHSILLPESDIPAGAKALLLHLWNERIPPMPSEGADLAYAQSFYRLMFASLETLGRHMQANESYQDVCIVGGVTSHVWLNGSNNGGSSILRRLGFTLFPYPHPLKKIGVFLENFYTWVLMWTFNPATLRSHKLLKLQRVEGWMTATQFLDRFGNEDNLK